MKYKTIGAFKNVQNVPYCKAASDMYVAMGVIIDRVAKTATLPASADEAKEVRYLVTNIMDKPELHNWSEVGEVLQGEYVRADDMRTVDNMEIEFANSEITNPEGLAVGDSLVFGADGKLAKADSVEGYAVSFEILALTAYMNGGVLAVIHAL